MFIDSYIDIKKTEIACTCFKALTKQLNNDSVVAEKQMFCKL